MRPLRRIAALLALCLTTSAAVGCGYTAISPTVEQAQKLPADDAASRLTALIAKDQRVAEIAWRLALSNADLCPVTRLRAGWVLQSAGQYSTELRPVAERQYGLQGDLPGILSAPLNSPARAAGLRPGDLILAIEGEPLNSGAGGGRESYDGLQANIDRLNSAAVMGPMSLTVRRNGTERAVAVMPVQACAYVTQVEVRDDLRALSDGRTIFLSARIVDVAQDDHQLAFLLAHELAHAVLEHATVPDVQGERGALNTSLSLRRGLSSRAESDADTLGLYLLTRAGFDPRLAMQFLNAYAATAPGARYPQINLRGVYPSIPDRHRALEPVVSEIIDKQATGMPLIP